MAEFLARWFTPSKSDKGTATDASVRAANQVPMPEPPKVEDASAKAAAVMKKKRQVIAGSRDIYTSPLGIGGEANIARKTLLGQ